MSLLTDGGFELYDLGIVWTAVNNAVRVDSGTFPPYAGSYCCVLYPVGSSFGGVPTYLNAGVWQDFDVTPGEPLEISFAVNFDAVETDYELKLQYRHGLGGWQTLKTWTSADFTDGWQVLDPEPVTPIQATMGVRIIANRTIPSGSSTILIDQVVAETEMASKLRQIRDALIGATYGLPNITTGNGYNVDLVTVNSGRSARRNLGDLPGVNVVWESSDSDESDSIRRRKPRATFLIECHATSEDTLIDLEADIRNLLEVPASNPVKHLGLGWVTNIEVVRSDTPDIDESVERDRHVSRVYVEVTFIYTRGQA